VSFPYATLETLRNRLRMRLGYSAAGASAGALQPILDDFLKSAQDTLYMMAEWTRMRRYTDGTLGVGQYLYDYPPLANRDRLGAIVVARDGTTDWSAPLREGFPPERYRHQANQRQPAAYQRYAQIEFDAQADQIYAVRVFYIRELDRFEQNSDRASIDDSMIFTVALGNAKAHYRHPDAKIYADERDALLLKVKAKNWGQSRFNPNDWKEEPLVKPVVV
jgi:hypothetical protein